MPSAVNAPGTPGYNPAWYSLANTGVYWDPANLSGTASDSNSGASALLPVLTWAEILRRFGSDSPVLAPGQNLIVNKMSAQTLNVDPVFCFARVSDGGYAALIDTLVVFAAASAAGVVTLASQSGGTDLTIATMPAGTTAGMLVFNSTRGGYAFVKSISSGTATMCQPLNTALCTTINVPTLALGTNWQTGDSITVYAIPNLTNLKAWRPTGGDLTAGGAACVGWVQFTQVADSSGAASSEYPFVCDCASNVLSCCYIAPRLNVSTLNGRGFGATLLNCYMAGAVVVFNGESMLYGGTVVGALAFNGASAQNVSGNCIVQGTTGVQGIVQTSGAHYIGQITVNAGSVFKLTTQGGAWGAAPVAVAINAACHLAVGLTSWVTDYLLTGAMTFQLGLTTGTYFTPATGLWSGPTTVNPINLDAAPGVLGSIMDAATGARFCGPT